MFNFCSPRIAHLTHFSGVACQRFVQPWLALIGHLPPLMILLKERRADLANFTPEASSGGGDSGGGEVAVQPSETPLSAMIAMGCVGLV